MTEGFLIHNEFATVLVEREEVTGGALLRIQDMRGGTTVWIDPLELEAITRLTREEWSSLVDPSFGIPTGEHEDEHAELGA